MARSLLKSKELPGKFWGEAVATAVFLQNRAPTKAVRGKTPYEALYGTKTDVNYLKIFGCLGYVKKVGVHLTKLADKSSVMIFIGYELESKAYRMYYPRIEKLVISTDVVFEEDKQWGWRSESVADTLGATERFIVHYGDHSQEVLQPSAIVARKMPSFSAAAENSVVPARDIEATLASATERKGESPVTPADSETPPYRCYVTPPSNSSQPSDEAPRRYHLVQQLLDETEEVEASSAMCLFFLTELCSCWGWKNLALFRRKMQRHTGGRQ
jgi:hypothetical protein